MKRYGGTLNVYYYVQEANLQRLYAVWFPLHGVLETIKIKKQKKKKNQWLPEARCE